ncbi:MAG: hypothetical protein IAG13_15845 [Deltaproteobacteria bacterium]|nr:hypothetical protein [Nannocystaceae bacterium]
MPFFPIPPAVFPPVVPAAGPLGDVPLFAYACADVVVAWSPPDGFKFALEQRPVSFQRDDLQLSASIRHAWRDTTRQAAEVLEAFSEETFERVRTGLSRLPIFKNVVVSEDEITRHIVAGDEVVVHRYVATFDPGPGEIARGMTGRLRFSSNHLSVLRELEHGLAVGAELSVSSDSHLAIDETHTLAAFPPLSG